MRKLNSVHVKDQEWSKNNIKMDRNETGFEYGKWVKLADNYVQLQGFISAVLNLLGFATNTVR
jgi:hypothetical protein